MWKYHLLMGIAFIIIALLVCTGMYLSLFVFIPIGLSMFKRK